jgi:arginase family enzyme
LTVEAIERFRGCRDVLSSGLTPEEIIEIFFLLGRSEKVKLVDISEFNPSV